MSHPVTVGTLPRCPANLPAFPTRTVPTRIALITTDNREAFREYARPEPFFGTAPTALLEGFAQLPEAEVHVVSCTQQPVAAPARLAANIHFHSLRVPKIGWLRTGYQGCIRAVRRKLREIGPEVIHAQGTERECALSAAFSPYPRVLTIHGNLRLISQLLKPRPWSALALQTRLEGISIPRFDGVVCITRYTQAAMEGRARRTWLLPNAVDGSFFGLARDPQEPPLLLCVATVDARKNQNAFMDAIAPLAERIGFEVLFLGARVGGGDYDRAFQERLDRYSWCRYGGVLGREALKEWFSRATALVLPSLEDNCPMTVLEAMASGVPVLAGNVGGVPDLVSHETNGLLCDTRSAESMREAVGRLLEDAALRTRLSAAGAADARRRFLPRVIAGEHLAIYREVLAGGGEKRKA